LPARRTARQTARQHPPGRDEIEIPDRGQALRDKIVLRLIAVDRLVHFLILVSLGIAVLLLSRHEHAAHAEFERVLAAIQGGVAGGPVQTTGHVGIIGELDKLFSLRAHTLRTVGIALLAYGLLEGVEAVGLWLVKRWAEYLTFIATAILLPFEVYELVNRVSVLKVIGFIINLAVVIYLIWAKRLFGLRGGGAVDEAAGFPSIVTGSITSVRVPSGSNTIGMRDSSGPSSSRRKRCCRTGSIGSVRPTTLPTAAAYAPAAFTTIGAAIGFITSEPIPDSHRIGTRLASTAMTVMSLGRSRCTAPSMTAASRSAFDNTCPACM